MQDLKIANITEINSLRHLNHRACTKALNGLVFIQRFPTLPQHSLQLPSFPFIFAFSTLIHSYSNRCIREQSTHHHTLRHTQCLAQRYLECRLEQWGIDPPISRWPAFSPSLKPPVRCNYFSRFKERHLKISVLSWYCHSFCHCIYAGSNLNMKSG